MKKVSVILTTYNSEKTLQRTLDSLFSQIGIDKFFELELLIIDDCSIDSTLDILRANNISCYSTGSPSGGPNKGRNIGLKLATGDYITFIDHDDTWEPDKLMLQIEAANSYPIISTGYKVIDQNIGRIIMRIQHSDQLIAYKQNETFINILSREKKGQHIYMSSLMIHNSLKNVFFEENFGMLDFDWILRLFENNISCEVPKCLVTRYVINNNLSYDNDYRRKDYYYALYTLEKYKIKYPSSVVKGEKRINGTRAKYLYFTNNMKQARKYLLKSEKSMKMVGYLFTSFIGSRFIRKKFHFFG